MWGWQINVTRQIVIWKGLILEGKLMQALLHPSPHSFWRVWLVCRGGWASGFFPWESWDVEGLPAGEAAFSVCLLSYEFTLWVRSCIIDIILSILWTNSSLETGTASSAVRAMSQSMVGQILVSNRSLTPLGSHFHLRCELHICYACLFIPACLSQHLWWKVQLYWIFLQKLW